MISANVQQVDNRKPTNANYNRRIQIDLAQYSNSRNSDNYFNPKDYQLIDSNNSSVSKASEFLQPPFAGSSLIPDSTSTVNSFNDQISALFPKCRPKNDANINKTSFYIDSNNTVSLASASALLASSPSSNDIKNQNQLLNYDSQNVNHSIGHTLTDTIHQRATSYTKMNNAQNNIENSSTTIQSVDGTSINGSMTSLVDIGGRISQTNYQTRNGGGHRPNSSFNVNNVLSSTSNAINNDRFVWEKRRRSQTPVSTVLNSPDLSDASHYPHHQIKVGRSPVSQHEHNSSSKNSTSPVSPIAPSRQPNNRPHSLVSDGEVVVFDDIEHHWNNSIDRDTSMTNTKQQQSSKFSYHSQPKQHAHHILFDEDGDVEGELPNKNFFNAEKVTKMIGVLPIAEYEGSPRRFGNYQQQVGYSQQQQQKRQQSSQHMHYERPPSSRKMLTSPTLLPPRPGFPQRITSSPTNKSIISSNGDATSNIVENQSNAASPNHFSPNLTSPFQTHSNNSSNSTTPSPAPHHQVIFDTQQFTVTETISTSSQQTVPLNVVTSSSSISTRSIVPPSTLDVSTNDVNSSETISMLATKPSINENIVNSSTLNVKDTNSARCNIKDSGNGCESKSTFSSLLGNNNDCLTYLQKSVNSTNANRTTSLTTAPNTTTFDYLYEFSETRKVLEDFFKCPNNDEDKKMVDCFNESDTGSYENLNEIEEKSPDNNYIGQRLAKTPSAGNQKEYSSAYHSPRSHYAGENYANHEQMNDVYENNEVELYLDSNSSGELADTELEPNHRRYSRHFTLSPETTDYDSNCGDLDSLSNELNGCGGMMNNSAFGSNLVSTAPIPDYARLYTCMPILEDGLSSGHASDTENNNPTPVTTTTTSNISQVISISSSTDSTTTPAVVTSCYNNIFDNKFINVNDGSMLMNSMSMNSNGSARISTQANSNDLIDVSVNEKCNVNETDSPLSAMKTENFCIGLIGLHQQQQQQMLPFQPSNDENRIDSKSYLDSDIGSIFSNTPLSPITAATHTNANSSFAHDEPKESVHATIKDIRVTLQQTKTLQQIHQQASHEDEIFQKKSDRNQSESPIWLPRHHQQQHQPQQQRPQSRESINSDNPSKPLSVDEEEADTDLETDRLLGQQRLDDHGFYDEKTLNWCDRKSRIVKSPSVTRSPQTFSSASIRQSIGNQSTSVAAATAACASSTSTTSPPRMPEPQLSKSAQSASNISNDPNDVSINSRITSPNKLIMPTLQKSPSESLSSKTDTEKKCSGKSRNKEDRSWEPAVLIEGVLFRARYLGSTQLVCEGQPTKSTRMMQAEEAVSRIKAPEGESQPSTEVDLFISTEKIMVLNTDLKEIMMDHALRTISYIADIGDLVVLMARRRFVPSDTDEAPKLNRTPKMICHVFESDEAQFIAQSIGQAFQVAYMEFLKANGIEDHSFVKEMDYQEVLNSQEIFGDELEIFAKKELQKEVVVPKSKGEILGMVIVESGWGSMLPTVVIANLLSTGAAARCGQLNIGDQIIAINGLSLVGLPLSTCQSYIRNTKTQTAVKFTVVPCPPVVEVKIKRPNTKYQLGFSVQNGVICSLLRGGIAERGGVRVGHRIIEINNQSVVAVPHEKIVNLLATSVGEILMKTMPTSMFRLLTGQENPVYI